MVTIMNKIRFDGTCCKETFKFIWHFLQLIPIILLTFFDPLISSIQDKNKAANIATTTSNVKNPSRLHENAPKKAPKNSKKYTNKLKYPIAVPPVSSSKQKRNFSNVMNCILLLFFSITFLHKQNITSAGLPRYSKIFTWVYFWFCVVLA